MSVALDELLHVSTAVAAGIVLVGLVLAFFGHRLFKAAVALVGLFAGALVAGGLAAALSLAPTWVAVAAVVGAVLGAVLFRGVLKLGLFLLGAACGGLLGGLSASAGFGPLVVGLVAAALAILGGLLALKSQRLMVSVSSAALGAAATAVGVVHLVLGPDAARSLGETLIAGGPLVTTEHYVAVFAGLGLALLGTLSQLRSKR